MKQLILILLIWAAIISDLNAQSNQRCYTYDAAGNRTQRACNFFRIIDKEETQAEAITATAESRSTDKDNSKSAAIVPNPASGEVEIVAKGFGSDALWNIVTQDGKIVMTGALIYGQKVDISHLAEGIYYMHIQEGKESLIRTFITTGH